MNDSDKKNDLLFSDLEIVESYNIHVKGLFDSLQELTRKLLDAHLEGKLTRDQYMHYLESLDNFYHLMKLTVSIFNAQ